MFTWLEQFIGDVRFGVGGLVRTPGFSLRGVHLLGRLKPNVTAAQAASDLGPIIADLK